MVDITDITIVLMGVIMVHKPTYNWGAPHCILAPSSPPPAVPPAPTEAKAAAREEIVDWRHLTSGEWGFHQQK